MFAGAGVVAESFDLTSDAAYIPLVGVADDRHNQAARRGDRDADLEFVVINDLIRCFIQTGVDERHFLERMNDGFDDKG